MEKIEAQGIGLRYFLSPFSTMHTSAKDVKTQVILLSIVSALLIIISLLNYILIVISSMVKRSKEVGVRKCYGAESKHIYWTLLVPQSIMAIAAVLVLVLVISIVVPAELYQRIPVYVALKNYTENSRRWKLGLLGVQVLINVFLVVMMIIIGRQYQMVSHANTGYDYKNLYYFDMFDGDRQAQVRAVETLRGIPEVSGVAAAYNLPYWGSNGDNVSLPNDERELFNVADQYECSPEFYELLDIQFLEGRAPRDSSSSLSRATEEEACWPRVITPFPVCTRAILSAICRVWMSVRVFCSTVKLVLRRSICRISSSRFGRMRWTRSVLL